MIYAQSVIEQWQGDRPARRFYAAPESAADLEYWLDEREGDLILHPRLPDARKLYIEATTGCNLQCRTCIRNVWDDPQAHMAMNTFQRMLAAWKACPIWTGLFLPVSENL